MTRIIAGVAGGRRLAAPKGDGTRPTADRVREAVFSRLEHRGVLPGASVLDLYAGSGALGLEAASRGAERVVLVEADRRAAAVARDNARTVGLPQVTVAVAKVQAYLTTDPATGPLAGPADVVFADPPYPLTEEALGRMLAALVAGGWLRAGSVLVVERSARSPEPGWPPGLVLDSQRRHGDTTIWYAVAQ